MLCNYMELGDCIFDRGNKWYENTERRARKVAKRACCIWEWGFSSLFCVASSSFLGVKGRKWGTQEE
jgi:6-phosphogluconate dehydrogenase (decarboxylating)